MDRSTVNRNVEIRDLPVVTDNIFNALSLATGKTKLTLYREALIEYGENHKRELMDYVKGIVKDNG
jgi:predicted DNA-binding protein